MAVAWSLFPPGAGQPANKRLVPLGTVLELEFGAEVLVCISHFVAQNIDVNMFSKMET